MSAMAKSVVLGGAAAIRANGPDDVAAIRSVVDVPVIGIWKNGDPDGVYITPTFEAAAAIVQAGAHVVALDATLRPRPAEHAVASIIARIHAELGVPVMADVDTFDAGIAAAYAGADLVATTLSGYTPQTRGAHDGPDLDLISALTSELTVPIVAEGRYVTGADIRGAFDRGAHAVVVGTAITNPAAITRRLLDEATR